MQLHISPLADDDAKRVVTFLRQAVPQVTVIFDEAANDGHIVARLDAETSDPKELHLLLPCIGRNIAQATDKTVLCGLAADPAISWNNKKPDW